MGLGKEHSELEEALKQNDCDLATQHQDVSQEIHSLFPLLPLTYSVTSSKSISLSLTSPFLLFSCLIY